MMQVTYISACLDSSGYSNAAVNTIAAMHHSGIETVVVPLSFEKTKTDLGELGKLVKNKIGDRPKGGIQIIHATPPNFPALIRKDEYTIGYVAWETSTLPANWVGYINKLNEVWVPSQYNIKVFRDSGVKIPITYIPHTFNTDMFKIDGTIPIENKYSDCFAFYSIFQWLERKNPVGMLKAYLTEFKEDENVVFILKTFGYRDAVDDVTQIKIRISEIKSRLYLETYPKVLLIPGLLPAQQILALHHQCDCYLSLNRCEGFGIPITEAMLCKKPVIVSDFGGSKDFIDESSGYPVKCSETPVFGMPWEQYSGNMTWGEPNLIQAKQLMRYVFEHREEAKQKGEFGYQRIKEEFSWSKVGSLIKDRLKLIENTL